MDFDVRKTKTQKCINGGVKEVDNAFIPMDKAKEHIWYTKQTASSATTP